jgi:hemoglobin
MKRRWGWAALLVVLVAAPAAPQRKDPGAEFVARMQKMGELWATLDTAKVAPNYAKDAQLAFYDVTPMKYTGWAEYEKGVLAVFADVSSATFALGNDARAVVRGNTAWGTATARFDLQHKDGTAEPLEFRWTVVWEKRGRDWLIVHEHVSVPAPLEDRATMSLYKRLGGYDAIAAVVDDFLGRLVADAQLKRFFAGTSAGSQKRIRQLVVDQLCEAAGGPCLYTGRTMRASHEGLNITEDDWNRAVGHLVATFDKFKVGPRERQEVAGAIAGMKADIVTRR